MRKIMKYALAFAFVLVALVFLMRRDAWQFVADTTKIKVPEGAVISKVEHPTEVLYQGTIDLKSASNVDSFIKMNGLISAEALADADGFIHKGTIVYSVPKDQYSKTYVLFGQDSHHSWEFILDSIRCQVRYEVLIPDLNGDIPGNDVSVKKSDGR